MKIKPFFINSNICLDNGDISSYERFMKTIAGNIGNSYITYALIKELFGRLVKVDHIPNIHEYDFDNTDKDVDYINNNCTHVFLVLQDQIRIKESYGLKLPYDKIMNFIKKLNKPVIIAGLGANSFEGFNKDFHLELDPELIKFLKFLSDYCIEIGVRGNYTKEILSNLKIHNVNAIGCPSFYEIGKNRILHKQNIVDYNSILLSSHIYRKINNLHTILQDYQEGKIIKAIAFNTIEEKLTGKELKSYCSKMYHVFSNIEEWKQFVSNFRFVIGNRMHGTILALNSGAAALCLNSDSRASEMCSLMKIPYNPNIKIKKVSDILKIYDSLDLSEMNNSYPKLFDNFVDFMHKNNLLLHFENIDENKYEYIIQPSLNLYDGDFYTILENSPFIAKNKGLFFNILNTIKLKALRERARRERERERE